MKGQRNPIGGYTVVQHGEFQCWEYNGSRNKAGYGKIHSQLAHRLIYQLLVGDLPTSLLVCHRCDNPCCINPEHLFLGTYADNNNDCQEKYRNAFGEGSPQAKTNDADVIAMRQEYAAGGVSCKQLGMKYGLAEKTTNTIIRGASWKHLPY